MFGAVFPLAAMCALVNNVLQIRADAWKVLWWEVKNIIFYYVSWFLFFTLCICFIVKQVPSCRTIWLSVLSSLFSCPSHFSTLLISSLTLRTSRLLLSLLFRVSGRPVQGVVSHGIGSWLPVLEVIGYMSVATNCALLFIAQPTQINKWVHRPIYI